MHRKFKSPHKEYREPNFKTTKHPHSPSPKRKNYQDVAKTKVDDTDKLRCTYIHPDTFTEIKLLFGKSTTKRCRNKLGLYPQYCKLHTMMIENLYIEKSNIPLGGNGLFTGPYGFKKGDIIGKYSQPQNEVSLGTVYKRCKDDKCWSYIFCDSGHTDKTRCWDGLDIRSTLMRNINDAHKSGFRNNAYFEMIDGEAYIVASRNIKPKKEIFVSYGINYWKNQGK